MALRSGTVLFPPEAAEGRPTTVCFWCDAVLEKGNHEVSHGLCERCLPLVLKSAGLTLA